MTDLAKNVQKNVCGDLGNSKRKHTVAKKIELANLVPDFHTIAKLDTQFRFPQKMEGMESKPFESVSVIRLYFFCQQRRFF